MTEFVLVYPVELMSLSALEVVVSSVRRVGLRVILRTFLRSVGVWSVCMAFLVPGLIFRYQDCSLYWHFQARHGMGTARGAITSVVRNYGAFGRTDFDPRDLRYEATYSFVPVGSTQTYRGNITLRYEPEVGEPIRVQYRLDKPEVHYTNLQHFLPLFSLAGWLSIFFLLLCVYTLSKGFHLLRIMKSGEITTARLTGIRPYFSFFKETPEGDLPPGESADVVATSIPRTLAGYVLTYSFKGSDERDYQAKAFTARMKPWMRDFLDGKVVDEGSDQEETGRKSRRRPTGLRTRVIYLPGNPESAYALNDKRFEGFKVTKDRVTEDLAAWQWIFSLLFETAIVAGYVVGIMRILG